MILWNSCYCKHTDKPHYGTMYSILYDTINDYDPDCDIYGGF